jgi:uncharacterized membrane protein YcaP (DUF421 family)
MYFEDVGIVPAIIVFTVIIVLYRAVTWLTGKSKKFEEFIEGKTECLIKDGKFSLSTFKKETLAQDEFFSELRVKSIEHLGQVKHAFIEPSGEISVFYYDDKEVGYGLPILPALFTEKSKIIPTEGIYSCSFCGHTEKQKPGTAKCKICQKDEWVASINTFRIT